MLFYSAIKLIKPGQRFFRGGKCKCKGRSHRSKRSAEGHWEMCRCFWEICQSRQQEASLVETYQKFIIMDLSSSGRSKRFGNPMLSKQKSPKGKGVN